MNETGIVMAIIGFIFGSIQYQKRINLQFTKESIYRVGEHYIGEANGSSIYSILDKMREEIGKASALDKECDKGIIEYKRCVNEWDNTYKSLHFWGIKLPFLFLVLYLTYRVLVFNCSQG